MSNTRVLCRSHNLEAARQSYGDAHMDLFTRNPIVREDRAAYGYATNVSTAWSLAVAAALPNPVAGVPMRTTRKFPPTRAA
jgi:hypothetical protein